MFLKTFYTLSITCLKLRLLHLCRLTGSILLKLLAIEEVRAYGPILLPLLYTVTYVIRAWAALTFVFLAAGFIGKLVPKHVLLSYLSSTRRASYLLASLLASLLTICSCVMIPIFAGLVYAGTGIDSAIAFLLTVPAANIMAIILTANIISWKIAIARLIATILIAVSTGYVISKTSWACNLEEKY